MNCTRCNKNILDTIEEGVNGSDYYECSDCEIGFNVIESNLKDKE